jgi:hypothetical protein
MGSLAIHWDACPRVMATAWLGVFGLCVSDVRNVLYTCVFSVSGSVRLESQHDPWISMGAAWAVWRSTGTRAQGL